MNPLEQIFPKLGMGKGVPGLHPRDKVHHRGFRNVGLSPPKSSKYGIFVINLPLRGYKQIFFTKFGMGRESQVRTLMPNCTNVAFKKCGLTAPKIGNFWYKFAH